MTTENIIKLVFRFSNFKKSLAFIETSSDRASVCDVVGAHPEGLQRSQARLSHVACLSLQSAASAVGL